MDPIAIVVSILAAGSVLTIFVGLSRVISSRSEVITRLDETFLDSLIWELDLDDEGE